MKEFDVVVIGAGTAGMSAYRAARTHTESVALVEAAHYGTTCARVGCMPSKLLIAAAHAAHTARHAGVFGVHAEPRIDGRAVMQRVRSERDRFVGFTVEAVERWPAQTRFMAKARFVGPQELALSSGERLRAKRVVIATGSTPVIPAGWREALGDRLLINDDVFDWQDLPQSIAVVGAGVIGLELAQALHQLGVRMRLYGRGNKIGPLTDPALQKVAQQVFARQLDWAADAQDLSVRRVGNTVELSSSEQGQTVVQPFDFVLVAAGRRAALADLDLAAAGVTLDARGLLPSDPATTQVPGHPIFVAGDVRADRPLLHEAADEGKIAGDNAGRYPDVRVRPRRAPLAVVFSDPQIMLAGQSWASLQASGRPFVAGEVSFEDQGRSRVMQQNRGALRVYGERGTGRFLGAEMLGPAAEHLGHLLAWSAQRGDSVQQMLDSPFYHPVVEEGLRTALRHLNQTLGMGPVPVERCLDCGPGA